MVKIYHSINETITIPENVFKAPLNGIRIIHEEVILPDVYYSCQLRSDKIQKTINEHTRRSLDQMVIRNLDQDQYVEASDYHQREQYQPKSRSQKLLNFSIFGLQTTGNIYVRIKALNFQHFFENVSMVSEEITLPGFRSHVIEIEIKGIIIVERNEYPLIPNIKMLTTTCEWEIMDKNFEIIVVNDNNVEEGRVQIHKDVLITQSEVFQRMLQSGMEEAVTNTMKITDFNLETVKAAIDYFYNPQLSPSLELTVACDLLQFAEKYLIEHLKEYIESYLSHRITSSTVCQLTKLSNILNSSKLQKACKNFMIVSLSHFLVNDYE